MEKTADLAMIQKMNIDALHKEGKSQRVITERCGCLQSAVSKHLNAKLTEERIWVGKGAQATGMTASLRILSSKADSNTWESFTRSGLKLDSGASRVTMSDASGKGLPSHFWTRDNVRSILPGLCGKRIGLLLSGPKSSFRWSKVNFAFHLESRSQSSGGRVERHRIHVAWSPVWSFHSQWWFWAAMSSAGVGPLCFLWSPQSTQPSTRNFREFPCFLLLTSFMEMLISFSSRTWHLLHTAKGTKSWFNDHGVYCAWLASKLAWPEPHRESRGYCQEEDERHQTQQCRWPEGHCQANGLPYHLSSATNWSPPCHAELRGSN